MVKNFISILKEHKRSFILQLLLSVIYCALSLLNPIIFGEILNSVTTCQSLYVVLRYVLIISLVVLLTIFAGRTVTYIGQMMCQKIECNLRIKAFEKNTRIKVSEIENRDVGELLQVANGDISVIAYNTSYLLYTIFINIVTLIGGIVVLFFINTYLAIFTIIPIPIIFLFLLKTKKKQEVIRAELREKEGASLSKLENSISGLRTIKLFTNEKLEIKKFKDISNNILSLQENSYKLMSKQLFTCDMLMDITKCLSYLVAALLIYRNIINVGDFTTFIMYVGMFITPLMTNVYAITELINGEANFKSFNEFMNIEEELEGDIKDIKNFTGQIRINNLNFSYTKDKVVLENININIESGQTVAFVGNSGCGKTSLCKLLYKFNEYNSGDIFIDGYNLKNIDSSFLRKNIGVVQQDTYIYSTSIKDNILYGNPDATIQDVIEACKKAQLHDFIMSLPDKYETHVGDKGVKLSGGEKQRIAIARIFLRNPQLVILDEATSALDNITEKQILMSLKELVRGRTCIMIAHRLSTVEDADKIFVFKNNSVVESGTHNELISKKGTYFKLYSKNIKNHK